MTTDPEFAISGYVVNGLATVYCRWVNKGQFQKKAWDGVPLASMDVRAVMDGFGVFVDSGVHQDGLVHISQVCNRFIRHPSEIVSVGDVVRVVVLEADEKKHRIRLSMKQVTKE